jgi:hypothetical protein
MVAGRFEPAALLTLSHDDVCSFLVTLVRMGNRSLKFLLGRVSVDLRVCLRVLCTRSNTECSVGSIVLLWGSIKTVYVTKLRTMCDDA